MEIKTSLKKLQALFGLSAANENLDPAVRRFAAQLTVLSAHVMRVEAKLDAEKAAREAFALELKDVLATFAATLQQAYPNATVEEAPAETVAAPAAPAPVAGAEEDAEAKAMLEQLRQEGEADKATILARKPAEVTPLHKPGNAKPSAPGAA